MLPTPLPLHGLALTVPAHPLTREAFAPFGDVVQNPRPDVHPRALSGGGGDTLVQDRSLPFDAVPANQGSAIKYQHVTRPQNRYLDAHAPSRRPGVAVVNLFVCAARPLLPSPPAGDKKAGEDDDYNYFPVNILERHPFTTQTFTPLSSSASSYLVIVAPNQQQQQQSSSSSSSTVGNPPDLARTRAFVATANQAVTYAPGTWHAPMVALGHRLGVATTLDFVVTQFANGVPDEDCQEVTFGGGGGGGGGTIHVRVPLPASFKNKPTSTKSSKL